jgi:hypothetical protein
MSNRYNPRRGVGWRRNHKRTHRYIERYMRPPPMSPTRVKRGPAPRATFDQHEEESLALSNPGIDPANET